MNLKNIEKRIKVLEGAKFPKKKFKFSKKYKGKYWRALTEREKKLNLAETAAYYDEMEEVGERDLEALIFPEIERVAEQAGKIVDKKDMVAAALLYLYIFGKVKTLLKKQYTQVVDRTVANYVKENPRFEPPDEVIEQVETQYINHQAETVAKTMVDDLSTQAQNKAIFGIVNGVAGGFVASNISTELKKRATIFIKNTINQVISDGVFIGKKKVNKKNSKEIVAFLRSEVLDKKTCKVCLDLDGRVVAADDPFATLQHIHYNCRGEWIPLLEGEVEGGEIETLPKSITDKVKTVGGVPQVNAVTNLKKTIKDE